MNKRLIGIIIVVALIVVVATIVALWRYIFPDPMQGKKIVKTSEGDIFVVFEDEVEDNKEESKDEKLEDFKFDVPENYTLIDESMVESKTDMYAKSVAYYYDEENNNTLVNVYLQNESESSFYKDAVCVITFFDKEGNLLERFGGVIEEDVNIPSKGTTIVKTNFLQAPGDVAKVSVDFENMQNEEVLNLQENQDAE